MNQHNMIWEDCRAIQERVLKMRRELHQIPELGLYLPETTAYVKAELDRLGISYVQPEENAVICAEIRGGKPGKTVALRADMDGLAIPEETGVEYASRHEGKMHACGHDAHAAMLLGSASVLQARREELQGNVRLIFQTGEENSTGGYFAVTHHMMDGVSAVFGMHIGTIITAEEPAGTIFATPGYCMAASDHFKITVNGKGCHGSTPEKGVDPIHIGASIVLALEEICAREVNACDPAVVTVGSFHGGSIYNGIPDTVVMDGTVRALKQSVRDKVERRIEEIAKGIAATFGAAADVEMWFSGPPLYNDETMAALAAEVAETIVGRENVRTRLPAPNMGGEDFSYYLQEAPGAYCYLVSANKEKQASYPHHNARFQIDEDVLWKGSALYAGLAETYLSRYSG